MRLTNLKKVLAAGLCAAITVGGNVASASPVSIEANMTGLLGDYQVHDWFTYYTDAMRTSPLNLGTDISRVNTIEFVLAGVVEFPILRDPNIGLYAGEVGTFIGFGRPNPSDTVIQWGMSLGSSNYSGVSGLGNSHWSYQIDDQNNFVLDLFYSWTGEYRLSVPNGIGGGTLSFDPQAWDGFQSDVIQDGSVRVSSAILRITGEAPAVVNPVPEPSAALLLTGGLLAFGAVRRRRIAFPQSSR